MSDFYVDTLNRLLAQNLLRREMRVVVLCGGKYDQECLLEAGLKNVTIANLDTRMQGQEFAPYAWSFQDAENLTFQDGEFDFAIAHSGLHHCYSPHRALLELYRVAKAGVLIIEPRDNLATRLGVRLGLGQDYEIAAVVADNRFTFGGVRNTGVPNYVYRWTEREVKKTISSFAPHAQHRFLFFYRLRIPWGRLQMLRNKLYLVMAGAVWPFLRLFTLLFPGQSNNFAFAIMKPQIPEDLHPWMQSDNGQIQINKLWVQKRYLR